MAAELRKSRMTKSRRLPDLLRLRADPASPVELLLDSWREVEAAVLAHEGAARDALTAASDALPPLAGTIGERRALATAVITVGADLAYADAAFRRLITRPRDLQHLLRRARREGPVVGLVEGTDGATFSAWIGDARAAARWPLAAEALCALQSAPNRLAVVVSAPSRSSDLAQRAACTLNLTAIEARLAEALLFAPTLELAAAAAGVGRETARDTLRRINAKAGVRRTPELVARLVETMCAAQAAPAQDEELAVQAFGVTPAEARAAVLIARGATVPEAALALGISPETVKSHVKIAFQKTGVTRAKDLSRLLTEARELTAMADATETVFGDTEDGGRLRVLASLDGARRIALIDYGPYDAEPVLVFHGAAAGRRLPRAFQDALKRLGLRPIVVQRPGYGLTDPAADHVGEGADDLAAVAERLRLKSVAVLGRDTGAPVALEFGRRHPGLIARAALLNPQSPLSLADQRTSFAAAVERSLLRNPQLVGPFAELLRRQTTTPLLERIVRKTVGDVEVDRRAAEDPEVLDFLVRDIQALCARSIRGFTAEHALYASGWEPPTDVSCGPWTVAISSELPGRLADRWLHLPGQREVLLQGAGLLAPFTHPNELAALVGPGD